MKKKRLTLIALIGTTALLIGGVSFYSLSHQQNLKQVEAAEGTFVPSGVLPESYALNATFRVPSGKISYNGSLYNYNDYYVRYPNGKSYKKDNYVLDIAGQYECVFIYSTQGFEVYSKINFLALSAAYTVKNPESYVEYKSQIVTNVDPADGLKVKLMENDMFTYNQIVDISNATRDTPIVTYHPYAHSLRANPANDHLDMHKNVVFEYDDHNKPKPHAIDAKCSVVRVTDAYDPENYFETYIYYRTANTSNNRQQQYCVVGASGQDLVGIERATSKGTGNRLVSIDGVSYREYIGFTSSGFGATLNTRTGYIYERRLMSDGTYQQRAVGTTYDSSSTADISNADDYGYNIFYEPDTKKVYISMYSQFYVNDLDEPVLHGSNGFKGFTTNEVYISIYFKEYNSAYAEFDLETIYGVTDFSKATIEDTKAPVIELDNDNNNFNIAVNEEFKLFNASVTDYSYQGDLKTFVYYEYNSPQQVQLNIKNNAFTPKKPGNYTIVYQATDAFGNSSTKEVDLYAITTTTNKIVDFSVEQVNEADAGQEITLPTPNIRVYNNEPIVKCTATYEDGEVIDINTNTWKLFLKKPGAYQIDYVYGDGISTYNFSYTLNARTSSNVYLEELHLPQYIIKDAGYTFDTSRVVKVQSKDLDYTDPDVYVDEDGAGFNRKIDPKDFVTTAANYVKFQYRYGSNVLLTSDEIPVKDVDFKNRLVKSAYFDNHNMTIEANSSSVVLTATGNNEAYSTFINPLNLSTFSFKADLLGSNFTGSELDLILTDYEDIDNKIVISFTTKSGSDLVYVSIDGSLPMSVSPTQYTISYNQLDQMFSDTYDNEFDFVNPFKSDRFYLSCKFLTPSASNCLVINSINDQILNQGNYDTKGANLNTPKIENNHSLDSIIDLKFFYPDDVLSPYLEKNYDVTVTYFETEQADGVAVTALDGTVLDGTQDLHKSYQIKLEKVGIYEVYYSYKDQAYRNGRLLPNKAQMIKDIYSVDDIPPEIKLSNGYGINTVVLVNVGDTYTVKGYKVSDNWSKKVTVTIFVISPRNVLTKLSGNSFKVSEKGDYRIYYYAQDEAGNVASIYYTVRAK